MNKNVLKNKGISKNIVKAEIDGNNFIRVTNIDSLNETINTNIYIEVHCSNSSIGYRKITPEELPINIVNKLAITGNYQKMKADEIEKFTNKVKELQEKVIENNSFYEAEFLSINTICDVTYLFAKNKTDGFYSVNSLKFNEFAIANLTTIISQQELPYVIMDIIDRNKFNEFTALIMQDHFIRVVKKDDKYVCIIYQFVYNKENSAKSIVNILDTYTIMETKDEFVLIKDIDSDLHYSITEENLKELTSDFLDTIGLKMGDKVERK